MKKELSEDYEISATNMLDIEKEISYFKIENSEFFIYPKGKLNRKILKHDNKQIFQMKDGIFILEVEDYIKSTCEYYYSKDITDLI